MKKRRINKHLILLMALFLLLITATPAFAQGDVAVNVGCMDGQSEDAAAVMPTGTISSTVAWVCGKNLVFYLRLLNVIL